MVTRLCVGVGEVLGGVRAGHNPWGQGLREAEAVDGCSLLGGVATELVRLEKREGKK